MSTPAGCSRRPTSRRKPRSAAATSPRRRIPWSKAANDDGMFRSDDELASLYEGAGVDLGTSTIAYAGSVSDPRTTGSCCTRSSASLM